jgi:hypothetical protein
MDGAGCRTDQGTKICFSISGETTCLIIRDDLRNQHEKISADDADQRKLLIS